ncbi:hypothetical protein AB1399_12895 [Hydrogenibacillus schlegelii]|uniref:hypothetical protein n=1 Tax=Hydrogenibacillus schlegelii TaxID=1484 RepID=UPI0012E3EC56|nr:hypothetical protein [Hydrogenibacillus schlegelii]
MRRLIRGFIRWSVPLALFWGAIGLWIGVSGERSVMTGGAAGVPEEVRILIARLASAPLAGRLIDVRLEEGRVSVDLGVPAGAAEAVVLRDVLAVYRAAGGGGREIWIRALERRPEGEVVRVAVAAPAPRRTPPLPDRPDRATFEAAFDPPATISWGGADAP